jgi:uncharacterized protein
LKKEYWIILIVYICMHLSNLVAIPLLMISFKFTGVDPGLATPIWLIASFTIALIIILFILRKEIRTGGKSERSLSAGSLIKWAILGFFLALFAQYAAAIIENLLGIEMGSENTQQILGIIETFPLAVLVTSIIGPILEEIVFRKIIFGALHKRFHFFIAALISSVIFAIVHMEPVHILIYSSMGFSFAYLYVKTKTILVPIFAHVSMNTLVVLVQSVYKEDIERLLKEAEAVQNFIGGFF